MEDGAVRGMGGHLGSTSRRSQSKIFNHWFKKTGVSYPTNSADVKKGQRVEIKTNEGFFTGKVESVLTPNQNFLGVKVRLDNGMVGRVRSFPLAQDADLVETFQNNLRLPESQKLEFKSSFLFDLNTYEQIGEIKPRAVNPHSIAKTVAAFANSYGGTLYVGVADDRQILGLERDYEIIRTYKNQKETLKFSEGGSIPLSSNGEFQTTLSRTMDHLFVDKWDYIKVTYLNILSVGGKDVCAITVNPSKRPLILQLGKGGKREFYVRHTDQSEPYEDMARFFDYWCDHLRRLVD